MINILLADDHIIVRNGIKNLLEKEPDINVVGGVPDGAEALQLAMITNPDIILADMNMSGFSGVELAEKLRLQGSRIKVILLTMHDNQHFVVKAIRAGVAAYLFKNINPEELIFAIRQVYQGKQYLCIELSLRLLDQTIASPYPHDDGQDGPQKEFSRRELDILMLLAEGFTNQEIADKLFTSKRTVEGHRRVMIENAGVQNTAALIRYAMRNKLIG